MIATRAGGHAQVNKPSNGQGMTAEEQAEITTLVFQAGSCRTIRQHVLAWEKMEQWAVELGISCYPLTTEVFLRYCWFLQSTECGPSVIPAMKYVAKWICKRLAMEPPNVSGHAVGAIVEKVYRERGKELKEAIPLPMVTIAALEYLIDALIHQGKTPAAIFVWWLLILVYGSLRWDDGRHVDPSSLVFTEDAVMGLVWQTKVDRKRRGTRFVMVAGVTLQIAALVLSDFHATEIVRG